MSQRSHKPRSSSLQRKFSVTSVICHLHLAAQPETVCSLPSVSYQVFLVCSRRSFQSSVQIISHACPLCSHSVFQKHCMLTWAQTWQSQMILSPFPSLQKEDDCIAVCEKVLWRLYELMYTKSTTRYSTDIPTNSSLKHLLPNLLQKPSNSECCLPSVPTSGAPPHHHFQSFSPIHSSDYIISLLKNLWQPSLALQDQVHTS